MNVKKIQKMRTKRFFPDKGKEGKHSEEKGEGKEIKTARRGQRKRAIQRICTLE